MKDTIFREIEYGSKEYKDELDLRNKVLRVPLGLDIYDEDLKGEKDDTHIGAFYKSKLAGVLVLTKIGNGVVRMRQLAVADEMRRRGIGKRLVQHAEEFLRANGYNEIMVHSRMTATGFYKSLGFSVTSEVFTEVMIPHVEMRKKING
ncbi:MAG: GNAT family N-acetyltransferase [Burkholderiales bacterium]